METREQPRRTGKFDGHGSVAEREEDVAGAEEENKK